MTAALLQADLEILMSARMSRIVGPWQGMPADWQSASQKLTCVMWVLCSSRQAGHYCCDRTKKITKKNMLAVCRHAQEQAEHDAVAAQLESARSQFKEFERKDVKAGNLLALLL